MGRTVGKVSSGGLLDVGELGKNLLKGEGIILIFVHHFSPSPSDRQRGPSRQSSVSVQEVFLKYLDLFKALLWTKTENLPHRNNSTVIGPYPIVTMKDFRQDNGMETGFPGDFVSRTIRQLDSRKEFLANCEHRSLLRSLFQRNIWIIKRAKPEL
jgi:hypothetical protein